MPAPRATGRCRVDARAPGRSRRGSAPRDAPRSTSSTVLRGTVCDLYSNLVTRPTGAAVRTAIERQVVEIGTPVVTTIDFSQVNLLDFSCADEIVAKLLLRYADATAPPGYLLFRGIHDGHLDPIETVLERHELALIAWHEGVRRTVRLRDATRSARLWELVRDEGPISAARRR